MPDPAAERTPLLAEWERLRYGMFLHWGMSTFTQDEETIRPATIEEYAPSGIDPDQWVRTAKEAGMRYAVLTAKHCYGHCLWPSRFTDHSVAHSRLKTDVCQKFVEACSRYGIRPGFYYLLGWDHHHQPRMAPAEYEGFVLNQLEELLTGYGPLLELWLDIPQDMGPESPRVWRRIYDHVKAIQGDCLVLFNRGLVDGQGPRYFKPTYFFEPASEEECLVWPADLVNGEKTLPPPSGHDPWQVVEGKRHYVPMEVCEPIGKYWFWMKGDEPKPLATLTELYRQTTGRGANLLLDVGPDPTGRIPEASIQRLMELRAEIL